MSQIDDALNAMESSVDAEVLRSQGKTDSFEAERLRLQALIDAGTATPQQIERFAAIQAKVDALDLTSPSVLPEPTP